MSRFLSRVGTRFNDLENQLARTGSYEEDVLGSNYPAIEVSGGGDSSNSIGRNMNEDTGEMEEEERGLSAE